MVEYKAIGICMTIKLIILAVFAYAILTYWTDFIQIWISDIFGWGNDSAGSFKFALFMTVVITAIFLVARVHPLHILGVNFERLHLGEKIEK